MAEQQTHYCIRLKKEISFNPKGEPDCGFYKPHDNYPNPCTLGFVGRKIVQRKCLTEVVKKDATKNIHS